MEETSQTVPATSSSPAKEEVGFLRNVPIFADLDDGDLEKVVRLGTRKKYKRGNIIVLEQEAGAALFAIISGKVKVVRTDEDGREVILSSFGPGEFFGTRQSGLPDLRMARISDVAILELARKEAIALFQTDPDMKKSEHKMLAREMGRVWSDSGEWS